MNSKWLVVISTYSLFSAIHKAPPYKEYRYYRFRWIARLVAWLDSSNMGNPFTYSRSELVGRITPRNAPNS